MNDIKRDRSKLRESTVLTNILVNNETNLIENKLDVLKHYHKKDERIDGKTKGRVERAKKILDHEEVKDNFDIMFYNFEEEENVVNHFHVHYLNSLMTKTITDNDSSSSDS